MQVILPADYAWKQGVSHSVTVAGAKQIKRLITLTQKPENEYVAGSTDILSGRHK